MDSVKTLEIFVDQVINHFLGCMKRMTGRPINLGEWLQLFAIGRLVILYQWKYIEG